MFLRFTLYSYVLPDNLTFYPSYVLSDVLTFDLIILPVTTQIREMCKQAFSRIAPPEIKPAKAPAKSKEAPAKPPAKSKAPAKAPAKSLQTWQNVRIKGETSE